MAADRSGYPRARVGPIFRAMEIEVFRAGNPAATAAGITAADLADVAAFDCAANPVPNVIGHPKHDSPAAGAVVKFRADGNSLFADIPETSSAFKPIVEGIKGGTILGRSMGFFGKFHPSNPTRGKLAPKHLGFLGGAAPGIAGLPPLASYFAAHPEATLTFDADGVLQVVGDPLPAVVLEPEPTPVVTVTDTPAAPAATKEPAVATPEEIAQFNADKLAHEERVKEFAATQRTARESANATTVAALVTAGKVLPARQADLVAAFNAVDDGEVIAFASDANKPKASPVSIIAGIIAEAGNASPANAPRLSPTDPAPDQQEKTFMAADGSAGGDLGKVRADRLNKYGK